MWFLNQTKSYQSTLKLGCRRQFWVRIFSMGKRSRRWYHHSDHCGYQGIAVSAKPQTSINVDIHSCPNHLRFWAALPCHLHIYGHCMDGSLQYWTEFFSCLRIGVVRSGSVSPGQVELRRGREGHAKDTLMLKLVKLVSLHSDDVDQNRSKPISKITSL